MKRRLIQICVFYVVIIGLAAFTSEASIASTVEPITLKNVGSFTFYDNNNNNVIDKLRLSHTTINDDVLLYSLNGSDLSVLPTMDEGYQYKSWTALTNGTSLSLSLKINGISYSMADHATVMLEGDTKATISWNVNGAIYGSSVELSSDRRESNVVPIPSAAYLLGSGFLGLVGFGRRRKVGA